LWRREPLPEREADPDPELPSVLYDDDAVVESERERRCERRLSRLRKEAVRDSPPARRALGVPEPEDTEDE